MGVSVDDLESDPMIQFQLWYDHARDQIDNHNAMCISTIGQNDYPDARYVLLKDIKEGRFIFYTNYRSKKGKQIEENPKVCLVFYWNELNKQIRIIGNVSKIDKSIAEKYWKTRPRNAKISAWASKQSDEIDSRTTLIKRVEHYEKKFANKTIPKPSFWGGYAVEPIEFEFWISRPNRLHDRFRYRQRDNKWKVNRLAP